MAPPARRAAKKAPARRGGPAAAAAKRPAKAAPRKGGVSKPGAATKGSAKKKPKVMRAGSNQPDSAELRKQKTKAGASGGRYKEDYHQEDLMVCVYKATREYREGVPAPGVRALSRRFGVPRVSIANAIQRMKFYRQIDAETDCYEKDEDGKFIWYPRPEPLQWNDPDIYDVKPGTPAQVPPEVMTLLVGLLSAADDPEKLNGASRAEANQLLIGLLDARKEDYPQSWALAGEASPGWWKWFFKQEVAQHLSEGHPRRMDDIRITAQTPAAVNDWFDKLLKPDADYAPKDGETEPEDWRGKLGIMTQEGMENYLKNEMPHIIEENGWTDEQLKQKAFELCHDPRLQGVFDQKVSHSHLPLVLRLRVLALTLLLAAQGHTTGGKRAITIIGAKGKPKQKRDAADGRWLSICPLVFGDGELGFLALVMQGSFPEERTGPALAADALAASAEAGELEKAAVDRMLGEGVEATLASSVAPVQERTVKSVFEESEDPAIRNVLIATSKSGYSNEVLHNDMFRKGCEQLKAREPWRFPFVRSSCLHCCCSDRCF